MNATPRCFRPRESAGYPSSNRDRIHYDQDQVLVTSDYLQVYGRRYPHAELSHIRTVRGPHSDLTINASLIAAAFMIVIARLSDRLGVDGWVGAVTVLAFLAGLAILGNRLRRRQFLMIAEFRGLIRKSDGLVVG
jgi:hypothetical protein